MKQIQILLLFILFSLTGSAQGISINPSDNFTYLTNAVPHYGLDWYSEDVQFPPYGYFSSFGGLKFFTWGSPRLAIDGAGNVGIGNMLPSARLEINSGSGVTTLKAVGANGYILVDNVGSGESYYQANLAHRFQGGSNNEVLTILSGGNVGIGVANPGDKLAVNGKVRAHEIKVETANWPDYVFAKDYQLPTLQETEKHINDKGHLPGIPSAAEVKANGIDLGEMNAKLLQKIEELTLHLIEMKKENIQDKTNILELKMLTDKLQLEVNQLKSKR